MANVLGAKMLLDLCICFCCLCCRLPAAPSLPHVGQSMNSHQLAAALQQVQQLQQEQLRMWDDFKQQARELQQLLTDKQAVAADRDAARAELGRVQELLQQQKQLQEAYAGQQQALLDLQQQQQFGDGRSSNQYDQGCSWDSPLQDCLDAFVVETQMVSMTCAARRLTARRRAGQHIWLLLLCHGVMPCSCNDVYRL